MARIICFVTIFHIRHEIRCVFVCLLVFVCVFVCVPLYVYLCVCVCVCQCVSVRLFCVWVVFVCVFETEVSSKRGFSHLYHRDLTKWRFQYCTVFRTVVSDTVTFRGGLSMRLPCV